MSRPGPLDDALVLVRAWLLDDEGLVRAVASGRRRGLDAPPWRRVELRYVDLKGGRHLQITRYDATQAHTANHAAGEEAGTAVEELLRLPVGNWHVETAAEVHQVRVTKKGEAAVNTTVRPADDAAAPDRGHDRDKRRLLAPSDPIFAALGLAGADGRVKPSRQAKYRQVEEFLRILDTSVSEAIAAGHLRTPTDDAPLRVVDLGCGNAYLTFAAVRLFETRGLPVQITGVDVKEQSRRHNHQVAERLGMRACFVVGGIADAELPEPPEVVLALHACDTATDDALARAIGWRAPLVLAAPCCHHDLAAQLRRGGAPEPYGELVRHGILRERLADTLTDGLRALLLRTEGYRADVMQFVESRHTPRNTLLRAVRTGAVGGAEEYESLVRQWRVTPRLGELLGRSGLDG